jgi:hypothetical protein
VSAGQNYAQLANASDVPSFKTGQLILIVSGFKRKQAEKKILLPYHITMSKIVRIESNKLYFEFPIDEDVDSAQIAANGNYDALAEINYEGVENVTIRNLTIDAEHLSIRSYGYKCHLDNLTMVNATRVIGVNAMAYSTITNIRGTFSTRGIEIKTGSSDILVRNVTGTYKAIPGFTKAIDIISLGQYCRNITIDSFDFDIGTQTLTHALIDLHARKATISNGIMVGKSQKKPFLKFFNEPYVSDPRFGCYSNVVSNVRFYGSPNMKVVMEMGDEENTNNNLHKTEDEGVDEEDLSTAAIPHTANVPPEANIVENCLFDGGSETSVANLNQGQKNILRNCTFTKAKVKITPAFRDKNTVTDIKQ